MSASVTVLMTVYNGVSFLREAIDSVLKQSFTDFEFLIVDDASRDESVKIVESYSDNRIRLIKNPTNIGQNASLNKGLHEARGEFIVRLDQDDVCMPERIEKQVAFLEDDVRIAVAGTWAYGIDERGLKISVWQWQVDDFGKFLGLLLLGRCALLHPSVAYRREIIIKIGGYDSSYGLASDYALWINLVLAKHRAALIPQKLVMCRSHQKRQSLLQAHKHQQDTAFAHEKLVRALSSANDISLLSSVLRIESMIWKKGLTREQIGQTLEAVSVLYENAEHVLSVDADEAKAMSRTVSRWLGPGVSLAAKMKYMPDVIFYATLFALSPLLVPGVRPLATRIVESWRVLRMLPERVIH